MNYFAVSENIDEVERVFRILSGAVLLSVTLLGPPSFLFTIIFPMLAAYFILTAIMKWDPVGYVIQIFLRVLSQAGAVSPHTSDEPRRAKRRREARGSREAASAGVGSHDAPRRGASWRTQGVRGKRNQRRETEGNSHSEVRNCLLRAATHRVNETKLF